jgi:hypothetical protein
VELAKLDSRAVVNAAITRTRKNAVRQLVFVVPLVALLVLFPGLDVISWILIVVNALTIGAMGRRIWRLRDSAPAVRALLERPQEIQTIGAWPAKVPAGRLPLMVTVYTRAQDTCSLLLDPGDPAAAHTLVQALTDRSPDAIVSVPLLPAATIK